MKFRLGEEREERRAMQKLDLTTDTSCPAAEQAAGVPRQGEAPPC